MNWLVLIDIDQTLSAGIGGGAEPADRRAWQHRLERPIAAVPAAVRALPRVMELARVAVVTGRPAHTKAATAAWLRRCFPRLSCELHLCPVGVDAPVHKAAVFRRYRATFGDRICAIDDERYPGGPRHFFAPPMGWARLIAHLEAEIGETSKIGIDT